MSQWPAEWLIAVDLLIQYPHFCDANKTETFHGTSFIKSDSGQFKHGGPGLNRR